MHPYILTTDILTIVIDSKQYSIRSNHDNFKKIISKIKLGITNGILELISIKDKIKGDTFGNIVITNDDKLYYKNVEIHNSITDRIIQMYRQNYPIIAMTNFLDNLMQNPSQDSIDELYDFLEYGKLPLTDDGHFLAYKKVNKDYTDCYTSSIDNSPGQTVEMNRSSVNNNRHETCSTGLHFCSKEYLSVYSEDKPVIILKINPKDVVSIPTDYNNTKGRTCKYEVLSEYNESKSKEFDKPVVNNKIINMNVKQTMVYSLVQRIINQRLFVDMNEVDLLTFRNDYPKEYSIIIEEIMDLFPKIITKDTAVRYFKFIKDNYGI
jgi:hypothetical protein